ncbi:hypothetical protein [Pseudorhodoferax aquiterrae]|nr:hypothetical protein [Pseudorhodoferax aquiterrae]
MRSAPELPHEKLLVNTTPFPPATTGLPSPWRSARLAFVLHALAMVGVLTAITALIERAAP